MREVLLTINAIYWLIGATIYLGVLTTLRLFLYPGWNTLRPETTQDQFTAEDQRPSLGRRDRHVGRAVRLLRDQARPAGRARLERLTRRERRT